MNKKIRTSAQSTVIIMMLSVISKGLGLLRESALAANYGANYQTDAYKVAFQIPSILLALVTTAIGMTFIPVYTQYLKNRTKEENDYFVNNIFSITLMISLLFMCIGIIIVPALIGIVAPGFKGSVYTLTIQLTLIMLPSVIFISLSNLSGGYLQANQQFVSSAFIGVPYNLFIIISIILFYRYGIQAVAIGSVIAFASQLAVQLPSMLKTGYRFRIVIDFKEKGLREIMKLSHPVLISSAFTQIHILVNRILASNLSSGSISALDYADKVNSLVYNIFIVAVITVIYPRLSFLSDDPHGFRTAAVKGIRMIILITMPMMVGMYLMRVPLINVLFQRGAFRADNTYQTAGILGYLSIGIIGIGFREMISTAFYSMKDTKMPMINRMITICINIILSIVLVRIWGIEGIAAALSASALISGGIMLALLRKKIKYIRGKEIAMTMVKSFAASMIMGIVLYKCNEFFCYSFSQDGFIFMRFTILVMSISAAVIIYVYFLLLLNVEEAEYILMLVKNKSTSLLDKIMNH